MVLERQREPLRLAELPDPEPGRRAGPDLGRRLRGLPHRPPHRRRRADRAEAAAGARPPDRRHGHRGGGGGGRGSRSASGSACPGWAGPTASAATACSGRENLCDRARFTGYDIDGGYAELAVADERYCLPIPTGYPDEKAAPLLCAGLIGYRALRLVGDAERIGFYGFGASAHILCQVAVHQGRRVFAFTREGDAEGQAFAREPRRRVGRRPRVRRRPRSSTARSSSPRSGELMPAALRASAKGARVISAGIHMSDIPSFPYEILWGERSLGSVANLTRRDGEEFLALAPRRRQIETDVEVHPLSGANEALESIRSGSLRGAAVLVDLSGRGPPAAGRRRAAAPGPSSSVTKRSRPRTIAAGTPARLVADEVRRRRRLVGDRDLGRLERAAAGVGAAAPVVERGDAGAADRDLGLAEPPGAAEAVGDDDAYPPRRCGLDLGPDPPGGCIGVLGQQRDRARLGQVRAVDPGVGADEAMVGLDDQDAALGTQDAPALGEDQLDQRRVLAERPRRGGAPRRPGSPSERRRTRPSALETIFCETTTTSPSRELGARRRSPRRPPCPRRTPAAPRRAGPSLAHSAQRPRGAAGAAAAGLELAGEGDDVGRGVEVERQRGELLDRVGDPRLAGGGDVAGAAALAEGGPDRARRARGRGRWCRSRGGRGRSPRRSPGRRSAGGRARAGRAAGSRRGGGRRTRRRRPRRGLDAGQGRLDVAGVGGVGDQLGAGRAASSGAPGSPLTTTCARSCAPRRSPRARRRASPRPAPARRSSSMPAASRRFASAKRFTGSIAVAFKPSRQS